MSRRITTDSPCVVGMVARRTSTDESRSRTVNRPSWGSRFSEMSRPHMQLQAGDQRAGDPAAFDDLFLEHAIDAQADAQLVLAGLDVDVRGASLHGVLEHGLQ